MARALIREMHFIHVCAARERRAPLTRHQRLDGLPSKRQVSIPSVVAPAKSTSSGQFSCNDRSRGHRPRTTVRSPVCTQTSMAKPFYVIDESTTSGQRWSPHLRSENHARAGFRSANDVDVGLPPRSPALGLESVPFLPRSSPYKAQAPPPVPEAPMRGSVPMRTDRASMQSRHQEVEVSGSDRRKRRYFGARTRWGRRNTHRRAGAGLLVPP
jgi:hypothetical protein